MARIVLVHGAFGGAWVWEPALPGLRAKGHEVEAIDLPGQGADRTPVAEVTLDSYARRICDAVAQGSPAVLVGQSMGGIAVTQAAARCPQQVAGLVYVGAFAPEEGQSLTELVALPEAADDQVQAHLVVEGDPPVALLPPDGARVALFNRATDEQATWGAERLGPQPVAVFDEPLSLEGADREAFVRLPRAYIVCTEDRAIPRAMQQRMLEAVGIKQVAELDADHWPWLSRTEEFVDVLDQVVARMQAPVG